MKPEGVYKYSKITITYTDYNLPDYITLPYYNLQ